MLAAGPACAEAAGGLDTLRDALRRLAGTTAVSATLERSVTADRKDVADVSSLLNHAPGMLADLDGAKVLAEGDGDWQGRPAHLLELELVNRTSKADSKWMKRQRWTMTLWTTADGVPLAADSEYVFRAGFLIFNFDGREARSRRFAETTLRLQPGH